MNAPVLDPSRCPLCGVLNQCALADGQHKKEPCWCSDTVFPPRLLDKLSAQPRKHACICRGCVEASRLKKD